MTIRHNTMPGARIGGVLCEESVLGGLGRHASLDNDGQSKPGIVQWHMGDRRTLWAGFDCVSGSPHPHHSPTPTRHAGKCHDGMPDGPRVARRPARTLAAEGACGVKGDAQHTPPHSLAVGDITRCQNVVHVRPPPKWKDKATECPIPRPGNVGHHAHRPPAPTLDTHTLCGWRKNPQACADKHAAHGTCRVPTSPLRAAPGLRHVPIRGFFGSASVAGHAAG